MLTVMFFFFFFSSRRRHTRSLRDWSSDVCSSDLHVVVDGEPAEDLGVLEGARDPAPRDGVRWERQEVAAAERDPAGRGAVEACQIGRASCRERVEISVVDGGV